jgi:DNA adenine methylase
MKVFVPPIKSQGIKTKLIDWIKSSIKDTEQKRWVEPFMGTGVVAFNIRPKQAFLCDSNPHLIKFYNDIKRKNITSGRVKTFLQNEGEKLLKSNGEYYYEVRNRFNEKGNSLDFLFLSRSCFNGMMRFNKSGGFNVPFCRKPNRFAPSLITKITNQVKNISEIISYGDYTFLNIDFRDTLKQINKKDLVYCDPPYIGRHVDYFDSWSEQDELQLHQKLHNSGAKFLLSTWLSNKYRVNDYIFSIWKDCFITTKEHFYHIGGKEKNRNAIYEALLTNFQIDNAISTEEMKKRISEDDSLLTHPGKHISKQLDLIFSEKI